MPQDSFKISEAYIQTLKRRGFATAVIAVVLLLAYRTLAFLGNGTSTLTVTWIYFSLLILIGIPVIIAIYRAERKTLQELQINLTPLGIVLLNGRRIENMDYEEVTAATFYRDEAGRVKRIDLRSKKEWYRLAHLDGMNQLGGLLNSRLPNPHIIQVKTKRFVVTEPGMVLGVIIFVVLTLAWLGEHAIPGALPAMTAVGLLLGALYQLQAGPISSAPWAWSKSERQFKFVALILMGLLFLGNKVGFWFGSCGIIGRYLLQSGCVAVYEQVDSVAFAPTATLLIEEHGDKYQVKAIPRWPWSKQIELLQPEFTNGFFLSPNGKFLAVLTRESGGAQLHIWDLTLEEKLFYIYTNSVSWSAAGVAFAPDSETMAFATKDHVEVWDLTTWQQVARFEGQGAVAYHPDGRSLVTFTPDNEVRWWRIADGAAAGELMMPPEIRTTGEGLGLAFSPDGRWLAANTTDGLVVIWQIPDGTIHQAWQEAAEANAPVVFSPDGSLLAAGFIENHEIIGGESYVQLWTATGFDAWDNVRMADVLSNWQPDAVSFSQDGHLLALTGISGVVLYDVEKLGP